MQSLKVDDGKLIDFEPDEWRFCTPAKDILRKTHRRGQQCSEPLCER